MPVIIGFFVLLGSILVNTINSIYTPRALADCAAGTELMCTVAPVMDIILKAGVGIFVAYAIVTIHTYLFELLSETRDRGGLSMGNSRAPQSSHIEQTGDF